MLGLLLEVGKILFLDLAKALIRQVVEHAGAAKAHVKRSRGGKP